MTALTALAAAGLLLVGIPRTVEFAAHVSRHRDYRRRYPASGAPFGAVWLATRYRAVT